MSDLVTGRGRGQLPERAGRVVPGRLVSGIGQGEGVLADRTGPARAGVSGAPYAEPVDLELPAQRSLEQTTDSPGPTHSLGSDGADVESLDQSGGRLVEAVDGAGGATVAHVAADDESCPVVAAQTLENVGDGPGRAAIPHEEGNQGNVAQQLLDEGELDLHAVFTGVGSIGLHDAREVGDRVDCVGIDTDVAQGVANASEVESPMPFKEISWLGPATTTLSMGSDRLARAM